MEKENKKKENKELLGKKFVRELKLEETLLTGAGIAPSNDYANSDNEDFHVQ